MLPAFMLAATGHLAAQAQAQSPTETAAVPDGEDIVVTGLGSGGYRLTADQLRDAVRAFEQHRAEFAPQATLVWRVMPASEAEGLELRLANGDQILPVVIDADARFTLPAAQVLTARWRLQSNAGQRQIRILPVILSPGSTQQDMRFGDARLLCRVFWAFANNQFSVIQRAMFGAIGGCGNRRVTIWYSSEQPLATATVADQPLIVREDGSAYSPPLHDRSIADDARLRLTYRP